MKSVNILPSFSTGAIVSSIQQQAKWAEVFKRPPTMPAAKLYRVQIQLTPHYTQCDSVFFFLRSNMLFMICNLTSACHHSLPWKDPVTVGFWRDTIYTPSMSDRLWTAYSKMMIENGNSDSIWSNFQTIFKTMLLSSL